MCDCLIKYYVFHFVKAFKQLNSSNQSAGIQLTSKDLQHAECCWVCHNQAILFAKELEYMKGYGKHSVLIYVKQFGLFLDDHHIMRCRGRIRWDLVIWNLDLIRLGDFLICPAEILITIYSLHYLKHLVITAQRLPVSI